MASAAWHVMISMLPELHAVGIPTSRPSIQDWAAGAGRALARSEWARTIAEVVVRLLEDAGSSGRRWAGVLGRLTHAAKQGTRSRSRGPQGT